MSFPAASSSRPRTLAISLDAADADLVLSWAEDGGLPTIQGLIERGAVARLHSIADYFPDAIWPSINTGCLPGTHGAYNWRCIPPGTYSMRLAPDRTYRRPFWEVARLGSAPGVGPHLLIFDVQRAPLLRDDAVTQIVGWGQRAATRRESWPSDLVAEVSARYQPPPRWLDDDIVRRGTRSQERYLRALETSVATRTALLSELLRRQPWDLCLASYHEAHNGGHVFHRYLDSQSWAYDRRRAPRFEGALRRVYELVDRGLGEVLAAAPAGTDVLVFSGHSLRTNTNGLQLLPRVMTALGYQVPRAPSPLPRLLNAAAVTVPWSLRRHVNRRLSAEARRHAMERMWIEATDWRRTRAFAETAFGQCWVRINLRGREPHGTVEPGSEYDALCEEIAGELRSLTNAETGAPAVAEVRRMDEAVPGPHARQLPDLQVQWSRDGLLRAARHPRVGVVRENLRDIAATEHGARAFLVAAGPRIRRGARLEGGHVVDIAPTLLYLLGSAIPDDMDGDVLQPLVEAAELEARPPRRVPMAWEDDPWTETGRAPDRWRA